MALYKRGEIWWYDFTIRGHRYRETTELTDKKGAKEVESAARDRAKLGKVLKEITLREAADQWFAARSADKKSAETIARRVEVLMRCMGGHKLITLIDMPDIAEAITTRRADVTHYGTPPSNSTVNQDLIRSTLRPIFRYARVVLKQPLHEIEWHEIMLDEPKPDVHQYSTQQLDAFAKELPHWHRPLRDFYARYGVRLREAFFPLSAVNVEAATIVIPGSMRKSGRPLSLPLLANDVAEMAARLGRAREAGLDTVWFKEMKSGKLVALTPEGFQQASIRAQREAGIDARAAHDLRHHAATTIMQRSNNLKVVQQLLGHESIQSTSRYAHVGTQDVLNALRHAYDTPAPTKPEIVEQKQTAAS